MSRNRLAVSVMFVLSMFATATPVAAQQFRPDAAVGIGEIITRVSPDTLMDRVRELCGEKRVRVLGMDTLITNRFDGLDTADNELAGDYLEQELLRHGLLAGSQRFQDRGRNVLGIQPGIAHADIKFIICAHYDAATFRFPGADDNASGSAGVLEAARLLSRYSFDYTIEYIFWDAEERGLVGSREYARAARARGDSIIGVFNLDMIAWDSNGDSRTTLQYNLPSGLPLIAAMQTINDSFALGLDMRPELTPTTPSDNYSFTQSGYPAFLLIEDFKDFTPYYHKATDLPSTLNVPFFTRMTQAAVGGLALMAGLRSEPPTPMLLAPANTATNVYDPAELVWSPAEGADSYRVQLASDPSFLNLLLDTDTVRSTSIRVSDLDRSRRFYWRVQACGAAGCSRWSEFWNFETATVNDVTSPPSVAAAQLFTPAPHPFRAGTEISFTLPQQTSVRVELYDMRGRRAAVIADGRYDAGRSSIAFDARTLPAGLYILRLSTPEAILQRQVIHLR